MIKNPAMETAGKVSKDGVKPAQVSLSQENIRDSGNFEFLNGDKYEGQYLAIKQQLSIVRDGQGTYWTNQSVYTGKWNKDVLEKADTITFPDNSIFCGDLENMTIEGSGMYKFKGIELIGKFQNNQLVGDVQLKDPNGHFWKALDPKNEDEILFSPVQPFWQSVLNIQNFVLPYVEGPIED